MIESCSLRRWGWLWLWYVFVVFFVGAYTYLLFFLLLFVCAVEHVSERPAASVGLR
jgi:hypothetical protein